MEKSLGEFKRTMDGDALPDPVDFGATISGNLDAIWAWEEFGGKTLSEAYDHFLSNPFAYSEAFSVMGAAAFRYYFSVIHRYVTEVSPKNPGDDCDLLVIGRSIWGHLTMNGERQHHPEVFLSELQRTATCLLDRLPSLGLVAEESDYIRREWEQVLLVADGFGN